MLFNRTFPTGRSINGLMLLWIGQAEPGESFRLNAVVGLTF